MHVMTIMYRVIFGNLQSPEIFANLPVSFLNLWTSLGSFKVNFKNFYGP